MIPFPCKSEEWRDKTPCYLYDFDRARREIRDMRTILNPDIGLCFAMKANPFLVREISGDVDRIEVCSMGEYRICRSVETPREKLYISGVLKEERDIRQILTETEGRSRYTAESPAQARMISSWAREHETCVSVFPRLSSRNQFGMDEDTLIRLLQQMAADPWVHVAGIHYFSGTQKRNAGQMNKELEYLREFFRRTPEITDDMELEYGPGLKVDYFTPDNWEKSLDMLAAAADTTRALGFSAPVTFEMGRGIAAGCGYYLTQVRDTKNSFGNQIAIVDGGIHQMNYDGQMMGMKHPAVFVLRPEEAPCQPGEATRSSDQPKSSGASDRLVGNAPAVPSEPEPMCWDIFGSLCTTRDILLKQIPLGDLAEGDIIVFPQTGAYSSMEGVTLLLSHELPAIYGYDSVRGITTLREQMDTWTLNHTK